MNELRHISPLSLHKPIFPPPQFRAMGYRMVDMVCDYYGQLDRGELRVRPDVQVGVGAGAGWKGGGSEAGRAGGPWSRVQDGRNGAGAWGCWPDVYDGE